MAEVRLLVSLALVDPALDPAHRVAPGAALPLAPVGGPANTMSKLFLGHHEASGSGSRYHPQCYLVGGTPWPASSVPSLQPRSTLSPPMGSALLEEELQITPGGQTNSGEAVAPSLPNEPVTFMVPHFRQ